MDLQTVLTALRNADAAGDTQAAQRLARIAQSMQSASPEEADIDSRLQRLRAEREELLKPKPTVGGYAKEAFKGLVPGAIGLVETAGTGIASMLPDSTEKAAREKIKELAGIAKKPFEAAPGYEDSVVRKLSEGLGSTLPFFAAGPFGLAGRVAAGGLGVAAGAGEARESAEAKNATEEERRTATLLGAPTGLLDMLAPQLGPLKKVLGKELSSVQSLMATAAARGGIEGATEAAQKIAQNLIAKGVYDPSQEILVGSGEEGAYGAGVGALASLIVDMTIGRKARRAGPDQGTASGTQETPPTTPPATPSSPLAPTERGGVEQLLLGSTPEAEKLGYTPKTLALEDEQGMRQRDRETSEGETKEISLAGVPRAEVDTVRNLLTENFNATIDPETGNMRVAREDFEAARMMLSDVGVKAPDVKQERDGQTRDLVDELETADTERLVGKDTSAELRKLLDEEQVKVEKIKQEASTQRYNKEQADQAKRLEILLPIVESEVKDVPKLFAQELKRAGITNTNLTEREQKLINRAYDIRMAEEPVAEAVKEKEAAPEAFSKEELEGQQATKLAPAQELTADTLVGFGLPKQSGFFKQLLGKNLADSAQATEVAAIVERIRANPNVSQTTKQAVEQLSSQLPKAKKDSKDATATKPAAGKSAERGRDKNAGDVAGGTGTRTEARKEGAGKDERTGAAADTKRTEAPKSAGLGDRGQPAGDVGTRTSVESGALKKTEAKTEAKTEPKTETESSVDRAWKMLQRAEAAQREADEAAKGKPEAKTEKPKKAEPNASFGAYGQVMEAESKSDALDYLAYDMYVAMFEKFKLLTRISTLNDINAQLREGKLPGEVAFGREGTTSIVPLSGGKYAKTFYESLSAADQKALAKKMESYFGKSEAEVRRGSAQFNVQQEIARATKEQMDNDQLELARDAVALGMPMHPAIRKALKAGDLRGALTMLGSQNLGRTSTVAAKLAGAIGKTKVKLVTGLKNAEGNPVAGLYDPKTDTITLDAEVGLNSHVLLHESVHAATSHVIDNKSHPVTKQLTELYNNVKGSLDTAYGAQSLDEFVAESFSNPEFQQKLAAINPKGEAITAWQRFTHAIRNFVRSLMGKDTKGMGTALDASDSLINTILSPAPDSRDAGSLFSASLLGNSSQVFKTLDNRILSLPALDNKIVGGIYELFREGVPSAVQKLVRRSLPLNALTEVAAKDIPMAPKLDELEKRWSGAVDKRKRAAEATMKRIQNWVKGNPEKEVILNDVIATSTLEQVDPSKSRDSYKGKQSDSGADKQKVWDDLQPQWAKLGAEGQSVYKQMRDTYAKTYEDLLDLMFNRIDTSVENKEDAKKLKTEIYQRLATKGKIEPYFPLTRNGDYRLSYDAKGRDGNSEHFVEHFETSVERERAIKELEKDGGAKNIQRFVGGSKRTYKDAPPTSFVNSILRTLEANKVDPEVTDEIMRTFLSTLPESSFAQAFRKRKNTPGFSFDAPAAFFTRSMSMAHQLANLEYSGKMYQLRDEIDKHVKTKNDTELARIAKAKGVAVKDLSQADKEEASNTAERARGLADELNSHIQTLVSPDIAPWSKALTSTAFAWTLGFNVSSAVVNMSQVPLVLMPYLGGKYGYSETTKAIGSATRLFFGSGLKRNAEMTVPTADGKSKIEVQAGFSLDNYDFDAKGVPDNVKRLKELSQVAEDYGLLSRSMTHDILDMDDKSTPLNRVNAWSGFIFHHGERMNRQISLIAAYELELNQMAKDGKKIDSAARTEAANTAIRTAELLNGGATAGSAPLLAKSSLGKVMFMYKRYGVSMYYMMFKTAREAMKSEDKKVREAAMRQIVGVYASAGMMAGVQGLPMFGILAAVYNMFKGDDEDDAETAARKYLGEGLFNGAVNYLTGTAVANRIGLSDLLINSTGYREQDNAVLAFLQLMGGPVYGVADRLQQGVKLIMEGETERGLERMLPAGIANGFKGIRFYTEGANTLRGDPITGDISGYNAGAQFLGFAPAEYSRQLEINASLKNIERRATKERTKMLRDYYIAARNGDSDGMSDALDDMFKFNKAHPGAAITAETIQNSMAQHMKTSQEMYHGVTLNKKLRFELLQNAAEYDNGLLD
jgi:hypothetical protein